MRYMLCWPRTPCARVGVASVRGDEGAPLDHALEPRVWVSASLVEVGSGHAPMHACNLTLQCRCWDSYCGPFTVVTAHPRIKGCPKP